MWRTIFIAFGLMAIILGFECLVIDSASFYASREASMVDFTGNPCAGDQRMAPWRMDALDRVEPGCDHGGLCIHVADALGLGLQ